MEMKATAKKQPIADRYVPVVRVSFHTEKACYQVKAGASATNDPTSQLIAVNTNKSLSAPAGTFSVTLAGDGWFSTNANEALLKPNDLVVIYMGYKAENTSVKWADGTSHTAKEDLTTVMIGLIDTVSRRRTGGGDSVEPSITTVVQGRDFGKLLLKANLRFYPELGWDKGKEERFFLTEVGWVTLFKAFMNDNILKGTPAQVLDTTMRFIFKKLIGIKWNVYDDNTFTASTTGGKKLVEVGNIMRYTFGRTDFFIPFFLTAQQYEGSLWNLMERVNVKPFTELFIDTRDRWEVSNSAGVPQVVNGGFEASSSKDKGSLDEDNGRWAYPAVMFGEKDGAQVLLAYRSTPFDRDSWCKLRKHTLTYENVIEEELSISDSENYNLFWAGTVLTPFSTLDLKRAQPPQINTANIERYGLSPLEVNIEGFALDRANESTQIASLRELSSTYNTKLKAWFENNIGYLSGSLVLRGDGSIKVGQRLEYSSIGREFYVETVAQSFTVGGGWRTTVNVTRGMPPVEPGSSTPATSTATESTTEAKAEVKKEIPTTQKYHTVANGDTLYTIARKYYGDGDKWPAIWEANRDMLTKRDKRNISSPGHWIYKGQILRIP